LPGNLQDERLFFNKKFSEEIFIIDYPSLFLFNCSADECHDLKGDFKFTSQYSALIAVGVIVGASERTFEIGQIYKGVDAREDSIAVRIAGQTKLNEDCPNPSCYQEFVEVPCEFLYMVK
jgi:hypothetical protein